MRVSWERARLLGGTAFRSSAFCTLRKLEEALMPAKSKKQQMAAGAALSAKRGEMPKSKLKGASRSMEESMSETELKKMASTERRKLPRKKS
jgi:hypothetical protein